MLRLLSSTPAATSADQATTENIFGRSPAGRWPGRCLQAGQCERWVRCGCGPSASVIWPPRGSAGLDVADGVALRVGTAETRAARSSSPRASPSASDRTVCGYGRRRSPRSRAPIALAVRPARSASSSWVSDRASRSRRSNTANSPGAAAASTGQTLTRAVHFGTAIQQGDHLWCRCGPGVGGATHGAARRWGLTASTASRPEDRP